VKKFENRSVCDEDIRRTKSVPCLGPPCMCCSKEYKARQQLANMCRKSNIDHLCRPLQAFLKTLYSICVCGCCDFRIHQESDGRTFREVDVAAASAAICAVCTQLCQLSRNERSADEQKNHFLSSLVVLRCINGPTHIGIVPIAIPIPALRTSSCVWWFMNAVLFSHHRTLTEETS